MFVLESTYDGAGTIVENSILMTDSESGAMGEAVVVTAGRLTKAAATAAPQYILKKKTVAGFDVATEYIKTREDQVFLADYTGAAPTVGAKVYRIDSTGLKVDGDQSSGGKVIILSVDTAKTKCRISFDV